MTGRRLERFVRMDGTVEYLPHWTWARALECPDPGPTATLPEPDLDRPIGGIIGAERARIRADYSRHLATLPDDRARECFIATATRKRLAGHEYFPELLDARQEAPAAGQGPVD